MYSRVTLGRSGGDGMQCFEFGCAMEAMRTDIFCQPHGGRERTREEVRRESLWSALLEERGTPYEVEVYAGRSDDGWRD